MKPYSVDLRSPVLAVINRGMSRSEVVRTLQVSLATQKRWLVIQRESGDLSPRLATGGRDRDIPPARASKLQAQVLATPDATIAKHTARWNVDQGTTLSQLTIGHAIRRLGLPAKKPLIARERDPWMRARFAVEQHT